MTSNTCQLNCNKSVVVIYHLNVGGLINHNLYWFVLSRPFSWFMPLQQHDLTFGAHCCRANQMQIFAKFFIVFSDLISNEFSFLKLIFFSTSKISSSVLKNIRFIEQVVFLHFLITSIVEIFGFAKVGLILSTHTQVNSTPIKKLI